MKTILDNIDIMTDPDDKLEFLEIDLSCSKLASLDFLLKFIKLHSNVFKINLANVELTEGQLQELLTMLEKNIVIQ